ncbi:MAG: mercury(II) reductase [Candidatus Chisholmbacteria bacterium]|nr:mercury(II) reductase [Candidatus Chisholmbacteria bacterium]
MNKQSHFDYIIIGAGSAGFAAAIKADELGAKTALVNAGLPLGGTCVNVGCVPSKTLLNIAQTYYDSTSRITPGIHFEKVTLNFQEAIDHELKLVEEMQKTKYQDVLARLTNVTYFDGEAKFISNRGIAINGDTFSSEKFLICNGSTAIAPPISGLDRVSYITHTEALKLKTLPTHLLVVGGGPVALEFAQMYAHFGSRVTILQRSQILKGAEPEISKGIIEILKEEGIEILEGVEFLGVGESEAGKSVKVKIGATYNERVFVGDELLVGTGKRPNTAELGLNMVGVEVEKDGAVKINEMMQTTNQAVYAAGDVIDSPKRLETTAAKEGNIATENALEGANRKMTYHDVPSVVFTTPAVASVGLTEREVVNKDISCNCTTIPFEFVPKAKIIGDTRGVIKMVIDDKTKKILGLHILSRHAEELIHEATLAVKFGLTLEDIRDTVHVFPTLSESIKLIATSFDKDLTRLSCCIE